MYCILYVQLATLHSVMFSFSNLNIQNKHGSTPLHVTTIHENSFIVHVVNAYLFPEFTMVDKGKLDFLYNCVLQAWPSRCIQYCV